MLKSSQCEIVNSIPWTEPSVIFISLLEYSMIASSVSIPWALALPPNIPLTSNTISTTFTTPSPLLSASQRPTASRVPA